MNKEIINHFKISSGGYKIAFQSDEKTAREIRLALIDSSCFWEDIQMEFHFFPTVITTIFCKGFPDINKFLELNSIRSAFSKALLLLNKKPD